jgi:hypothetical protein
MKPQCVARTTVQIDKATRAGAVFQILLASVQAASVVTA